MKSLPQNGFINSLIEMTREIYTLILERHFVQCPSRYGLMKQLVSHDYRSICIILEAFCGTPT